MVTNVMGNSKAEKGAGSVGDAVLSRLVRNGP